jgi:hypothetical protein
MNNLWYLLDYKIAANITISVGSPEGLAHVQAQVSKQILIHVHRFAVISSRGITPIHRLGLLFDSDPPFLMQLQTL